MKQEIAKHPCTFFATASDFRTWLHDHHASDTELLIGFYKKSAKSEGLTYADALDEALCFGWIDGVRKSLDSHSYTIRFTPRKKGSIWSLVNLAHVARLTKADRMAPSGLRAFEARQVEKTGVYSFENQPRELSAEAQARFVGEEDAWKFFSKQAPSYRRVAIWWVTSAKKEETQSGRLTKLIQACKEGRKMGQFDSKKPGTG